MNKIHKRCKFIMIILVDEIFALFGHSHYVPHGKKTMRHLRTVFTGDTDGFRTAGVAGT